MSASTDIRDRFTFGIVLSGAKRYSLRAFRVEIKLSYLLEKGLAKVVFRALGSTMAYVFVSYAKIDRPLALKLAATFEVN